MPKLLTIKHDYIILIQKSLASASAVICDQGNGLKFRLNIRSHLHV